jgi:hypothetical protein
MARWNFQDDKGLQALLPTEFNHYEGALARTLGLPTLVLVQQDVMRRVVFDPTFGGFVGEIPPEADSGWLKTEQFRVPFGYWRMQLYQRRDVFLGYCSSGLPRQFEKLSSSGRPFSTGKLTLSQVVRSLRSKGCLALQCRDIPFTKDDDLVDKGVDISAPRDNVVFEAGYFIGLRGECADCQENGSDAGRLAGIYALLRTRWISDRSKGLCQVSWRPCDWGSVRYFSSVKYLEVHAAAQPVAKTRMTISGSAPRCWHSGLFIGNMANAPVMSGFDASGFLCFPISPFSTCRQAPSDAFGMSRSGCDLVRQNR